MQRAARIIGVLTTERKIPKLSDGTEELLPVESFFFLKFQSESKEYVPKVIHHFRQETDLFTKQSLRLINLCR